MGTSAGAILGGILVSRVPLQRPEGGAHSGHDIILGRGVVVDDGARAGARADARGLAGPPRLR
jgi:hypothetical protein